MEGMRMKKTLRILLLTAITAALLTVFAFAATSGVTETEADVTTSNGVTFACYKYTATLAAGANGEQTVTLTAGNMYVLLVTKEPIANGITAAGIMYIDQTTATADDVTNGCVSFTNWIPRNFNGGYAYVTGTGLTSPILLGNVTTSTDAKSVSAHGMLGDMDGNGMFKSNDALIILKASVGNYTLATPEQRMLADINVDNLIKSNDALLVLKRSVGNVDENFEAVK